MKKIKNLGLLALLAGYQILTIQPAHGADVTPKVIYGNDDRHDVADYTNEIFRNKAKSVAGMVGRHELSVDVLDSDFFNFHHRTAEEEQNLCPDERFAEQLVLPSCSGFLVGKDTLVTAGHCIQNEFQCKTRLWVFDFVNGTERINKDNVYGCKEIIKTELYGTKWKLRDYAVIKLDREVTGDRPSLEYRKKGKPFLGTKLVVIGHPFGLPLKIADGAKVKSMNWKEWLRPISSLVSRKNYFTANLDTYGGNSGSPVFNKKTGLVEGILVEGAEDFKKDYDNFCQRSIVKGNSGFVAEEKVFRITKVDPLQDNDKAKKAPDDDDE